MVVDKPIIGEINGILLYIIRNNKAGYSYNRNDSGVLINIIKELKV